MKMDHISFMKYYFVLVLKVKFTLQSLLLIYLLSLQAVNSSNIPMEEENEGEKHLPNSFSVLCGMYHLAGFSYIMGMVTEFYAIIAEYHKHTIYLNTEAKICWGEQCVSAYVVSKVNGVTTFECTLVSSTHQQNI